jgi:hypothetical protein
MFHTRDQYSMAEIMLKSIKKKITGADGETRIATRRRLGD